MRPTAQHSSIMLQPRLNFGLSPSRYGQITVSTTELLLRLRQQNPKADLQRT
jgi:hypothetical protein